MPLNDDSVQSIILSNLIFIVYTGCKFIIIIAMPYFNISFRKIPVLIMGLLFAKDVFLFIFILRAEELSGLISSKLNFCIQIYATLYILRQLKIILLQEKGLNNTVTYIQYLLIFKSISIIFDIPLGRVMIHLSTNNILFVYLFGLIFMSILAFGIFKSFFGDYSGIEQQEFR